MIRAAWAVLLVGALAGCSASAGDTATVGPTPSASAVTPSASPTPSAQDRYQHAVLADRPTGFWTLADVKGLHPGDAVEDASPAARDAQLVEGTPLATTGPAGEPAARFTGKGRVVTPEVGALRPGRPFSLEFFFRADDCSRHWTQVAGTASYTRGRRQGVNILHYPRFFSTGCHLAVEFWDDNHYVGGCGPHAVAHTGTWLHFAVTYDGRSTRCYADGRLAGTSPIPHFGYVPTTPLGIGGAGSGYAGTLDSGSLADVALYPTALPAAAVRRHVAALRG